MPSNPKGIATQSPGLRGTSYPGKGAPTAWPQPQRGCGFDQPQRIFRDGPVVFRNLFKVSVAAQLKPRVARNELPWESEPSSLAQPQRGCGFRQNPCNPITHMPQSLSAVYIHLTFSTKDRRPFLREKPLRASLHGISAAFLKPLNACLSLLEGSRTTCICSAVSAGPSPRPIG
jgi:hypothetical protein